MLKEALSLPSKTLMSFLYSYASQCVCVSQKVFHSWRIESSHILYNPVERKCEVLARKKRQIKHIALVGHLIDSKGIPDFLRDYAHQLQSQKIEISVWGRGELEEKLKAAYPFIHWRGFTHELQSELQECDLLVLPSRKPESFGLVLVEAARVGIPSLTTKGGGQQEISEILQGPGYCYDLEDRESFWEVLRKLEKNYEKLSNDGLAHSESYFSLERFGHQALPIFGKRS